MHIEIYLTCLPLAKQLKYNYPVKHQRHVLRKISTFSIFALSDILAIITGSVLDWILGHICSIKGHVLLGITNAILHMLGASGGKKRRK